MLDKKQQDVAAKCIDYRAANELTQRAMAERVGLSLRLIGQIERGEPIKHAVKLAKLRIFLENNKQGERQ